MNRRSSWIGGSLLAALVFGLLAVPEADARGGRGGGHSGGGHPPRITAAHRSFKPPSFKAPSFKAPKMPHAAAPARNNAMRGQVRTNNNAMTRANNAATHANSAQTRANNSQTRANRAATTDSGTTHPASTTASTGTTTHSPYHYTYGTGNNARNYRAYGYGRGYRNRYSGGGYGYGRSQSNTRAVVSRLRSAHRTLARIDTDYQGHRVRAMHSISMAVRQLSHRSMVSGNMGIGNGMNNNLAMARRQGGFNGNVGGLRNQNQNRNRNQRMPQAQSDAQMSLALRTLQGANMQLTSQGSNTSGHARARGHVQHAMRELNTALSIR